MSGPSWSVLAPFLIGTTVLIPFIGAFCAATIMEQPKISRVKISSVSLLVATPLGYLTMNYLPTDLTLVATFLIGSTVGAVVTQLIGWK